MLTLGTGRPQSLLLRKGLAWRPELTSTFAQTFSTGSEAATLDWRDAAVERCVSFLNSKHQAIQAHK